MITTWTSAAGLEIRGEHLLLASLKKGFKSIAVSGFRRIPNFRQLSVPELKRQIYSFLREKHIPKECVILGLPRDQVMIRFLSLPVEVKANLPQVMKFQVDNYEPSEDNGFYYDFCVVGETVGGEGTSKISVLLALVRKSVLDEYLALFRDVQISFRSIQVSTFALWRLFIQGRERFKKEPYFLYHFGEKEVEVIGLQGKLPVYSGVLPLNGEEPFTAPQVTVTLEQGLSSARLQADAVEGIYYSGINSEGRRREIASEIPDVGLLTSHMKLSSPLSMASELPDLATPMGLALDVFQGTSVPGLNLLPEERRIRKSPYAMVPTYVLLTFLLLLTAAYFGRDLVQTYFYSKDLEKEIADLKPQVEEVEAIRREMQQLEVKIKYLEKTFCARDGVLEALSEMTTLLPDDTYYNFLSSRETDINTRGMDLTIQGLSSSANQVPSLLSKSSYLKSVMHQSAVTTDPTTKKERFYIKARLEAKGCN